MPITITPDSRDALMQKPKADLVDRLIAMQQRLDELEREASGVSMKDAGQNKIEQQLRHAIEMLPHPVIIYDLNDYLVFFNRAYRNFFSFMPPYEEVVGKHFLEIIQHSINEPGVIVDPLLEENPQAYLENRLNRLHNPSDEAFEQFTSGRWQLVSEHKIEDLGFFSIRQDITERIEAERALAVAKEEAETANHAKSTFLAAMSHEIRTPMNGVIAMSELFAQTDLDSGQKRMMEIIHGSAFSLLQIIDDILDFSKIEAGKLALEAVAFSIRDTVESVAMNLQPNALKNDIRLRIYIDPEIPEWLIGDPGRVRQILFNLAGNAIKFTKAEADQQNAVFIKAEKQAMDDDKVKVCFSVQDMGIGIDKDKLAGLFEPFTQAERSTTRKYGGSGLGLSISSNLANMMNGEINVESELGVGSTFSAVLPFDLDMVTPPRGDEPDLSGLHCLMVIAQDDAGNIGGSYLESKGCRVSNSGELGRLEETLLQAVGEGGPVNVVVIGATWPQNDQQRVINDIRANPDLEGVCFLILKNQAIGETGMILPDMVVVTDFPLCRSSFLYGAAMASGRASPIFLGRNEEIENPVIQQDITLNIKQAEQQGRLILIAEDNETNQEVIVQQLGNLGYAAEVAADGKQALKAWRSGRYALLLTDCHMPEMDGFKLTALIREDEKGGSRRMPIIAISANVLQGEGERCLAAGMDDFLLKPVELQKLKSTLLEWMPDTRGIIDPSALNKYIGKDPVVQRRMLGKFVGPARETARQIQADFEQGDTDMIGLLAHRMKSSARSIGANELADACQVLETAVDRDDKKSINDLAPKIAGQVEIVCNFIEKS